MKTLLMIIDFQNIFANEKLGHDERYALEDKISYCIKNHLDSNSDIAFTLDEKGYAEDKALFGSVGKYLDSAVAVFSKNTYGSIEMGNWLRANLYGKIEICGLVTDMCVLANAVIAQSACPNAEIVIDSGLTASYNNELGLKALEIMKGLKMTVL